MKMQEIKGTTEVGMPFIRQEEIDSGMQVHNLAPPRNHYSCTVTGAQTEYTGITQINVRVGVS